MLDSGATSQFIDSEFCRENNFKLQKKETPETLTVVNGRTGENLITYKATLALNINGYCETLTFQVVDIYNTPIILGITWLRKHEPTI